MTIGLDLVTGTLQKIGVYSPGEQVPDDDAAATLTIINDMLDMWSNESLAVYANVTQSFPMIAGQTTYTIGPGGQINAARPLTILDDPGTAWTVDGGGFKYPARVVQQAEWNQIAAGNISFVQSTIALLIFYDPQFPLGIINMYPAPASGFTFFFNYRMILSDLTLAGNLSLPPGYVKAIKDNAAVQAWPYFKADNSTPPANVMRDALQSLAVIKRMNSKQILANSSGGFGRGGRSSYNIYTDNYANG